MSDDDDDDDTTSMFRLTLLESKPEVAVKVEKTAFRPYIDGVDFQAGVTRYKTLERATKAYLVQYNEDSYRDSRKYKTRSSITRKKITDWQFVVGQVFPANFAAVAPFDNPKTLPKALQ
eukprot:2048683-Rhodomonas_salina.2